MDANNLHDRLLLKLMELKKEKQGLCWPPVNYWRLRNKYKASNNVYEEELVVVMQERQWCEMTNSELVSDGTGGWIYANNLPKLPVITKAGLKAISNGELISETRDRWITRLIAWAAVVIAIVALFT